MTDLRTIPLDRSGVAATPSMEAVLDELQQYGRPRVHQFSDGTWGTTVQMHIAAAGASFEIKSDYNHPTHIASALQCVSRVREAMRKFAAGPQ